MWKTGSHWLLMDQLINRQKSHSYLHFQAIFLSLSFESATNCNPCENRIDVLSKYGGIWLYKHLLYFLEILGIILSGL